MKCVKCGYENQQYFEFCPCCGESANANIVSLNPVADRVLCALKSGWFLTICILTSVSCILGFSNDGLPVFNILFTIFLWLVFAASRKDIADARYIRNVSGTVFAYFVVGWVLTGLLIFFEILIALVFSVASNNIDFSQILYESLLENDIPVLITEEILNIFSSLSVWFFIIFFLLLIAFVYIFNVLAIRKIHKFVQSVYRSIEMCTFNFVKAKAARNWLFVLGGLQTLSALATITNFTVCTNALCIALIEIFTGVLINIYFIPKNADI